MYPTPSTVPHQSTWTLSSKLSYTTSRDPVWSHILHQGTQYDHIYHIKGPMLYSYQHLEIYIWSNNYIWLSWKPLQISLCEGYRSFISWWLTLLHYRKCNMITRATFEYKDHLTSYDVSQEKPLWDHLFFIMEITSVVRWHLHIGTYPWGS